VDRAREVAMNEIPVVAMWVSIVPPDRHMADHFPDEMLGYLRVFLKQAPLQVGSGCPRPGPPDVPPRGAHLWQHGAGRGR
jgi:hypothetical protein